MRVVRIFIKHPILQEALEANLKTLLQGSSNLFKPFQGMGEVIVEAAMWGHLEYPETDYPGSFR